MYKASSARLCNVDKVDTVWVLGESEVYNVIGLIRGDFMRGAISDTAAVTFREGRRCWEQMMGRQTRTDWWTLPVRRF